MRRNVRPVEGTERRFQLAPAGIGLRALLCLGMAAETAGRLRDVQAALRVALREGVAGEEHQRQQREKQKRDVATPLGAAHERRLYCFSRYASWQAPPALATAPICDVSPPSSPRLAAVCSLLTPASKRSTSSSTFPLSVISSGLARLFSLAVLGWKPSHGICERAAR